MAIIEFFAQKADDRCSYPNDIDLAFYGSGVALTPSSVLARIAILVAQLLGEIVLHDRGRLLLFHHTYRPFAPWGLPSGVLRPGESLEDSMKREVLEEAGLTIEFDEMLRAKASLRPQRVDVWMKYHALGGTPIARSAEIDAAQFFDLDGLPDLIREQRAFLDEYHARISKAGPSRRDPS